MPLSISSANSTRGIVIELERRERKKERKERSAYRSAWCELMWRPSCCTASRCWRRDRGRRTLGSCTRRSGARRQPWNWCSLLSDRKWLAGCSRRTCWCNSRWPVWRWKDPVETGARGIRGHRRPHFVQLLSSCQLLACFSPARH